MRIAQIKIRHFRKLEDVSIDLEHDKTVFIGANNSGKTSAMTAIRYFLNKKDASHFNVYDFSLFNHSKINAIGKLIENEIIVDDKPIPNSVAKNEEAIDSTKEDLLAWKGIFPSLDIWFHVNDDDIHYVSHILPTLDWEGGDIGVRLQYEPKDIKEFHAKYQEERQRIDKILLNTDSKCEAKLFPMDMIDFLKRKLSTYFEIKFYVLDPSQKMDCQIILGEPLGKNPLTDLIYINEINAQRGLNDEVTDTSIYTQKHLSQQLTEYYNQHLDPFKEPSIQDIDALNTIHNAEKTFNESIRQGLKPALIELNHFGYPGFYNPKIQINPQLKQTDGLSHNSALQYELDGCKDYFLPESYNGLGYQNLIFIAFKLIRFRDAWLKIGKQNVEQANTPDFEYPPIHLVLVEEPEAHLHPQAQQVFIKQAYALLVKSEKLKGSNLTTQLIVTTHSSHITHECDFANLRYFKRIKNRNSMQCCQVLNISNTFGTDIATKNFVSRYIKITHCDLFFADAVILIEGDAERILLPKFIDKFQSLTQAYISILNIGGSHAHRLRPLLEKIEIPSLIITDLDAVIAVKRNDKQYWESAPVSIGQQQNTANTTLKDWLPKKILIDDLVKLTSSEKSQEMPFHLRVAYQKAIELNGETIYPYTFEDSLVFENKTIFNELTEPTGMLKKIGEITDATAAFDIIRSNGFKKAEFALDVLCMEKFDSIHTPAYIEEGLQWLENILTSKMNPTSDLQGTMETQDGK